MLKRFVFITAVTTIFVLFSRGSLSGACREGVVIQFYLSGSWGMRSVGGREAMEKERRIAGYYIIRHFFEDSPVLAYLFFEGTCNGQAMSREVVDRAQECIVLEVSKFDPTKGRFSPSVGPSKDPEGPEVVWRLAATELWSSILVRSLEPERGYFVHENGRIMSTVKIDLYQYGLPRLAPGLYRIGLARSAKPCVMSVSFDQGSELVEVHETGSEQSRAIRLGLRGQEIVEKNRSSDAAWTDAVNNYFLKALELKPDLTVALGYMAQYYLRIGDLQMFQVYADKKCTQAWTKEAEEKCRSWMKNGLRSIVPGSDGH